MFARSEFYNMKPQLAICKHNIIRIDVPKRGPDGKQDR